MLPIDGRNRQLLVEGALAGGQRPREGQLVAGARLPAIRPPGRIRRYLRQLAGPGCRVPPDCLAGRSLFQEPSLSVHHRDGHGQDLRQRAQALTLHVAAGFCHAERARQRFGQ